MAKSKAMRDYEAMYGNRTAPLPTPGTTVDQITGERAAPQPTPGVTAPGGQPYMVPAAATPATQVVPHSSLPEATRKQIATHQAAVKTATGKTIPVDADLAPIFQALVNKAAEMGYPITEIGGYFDRDKIIDKVVQTGKPSNHARGTAVDINPDDNTQGAKGTVKTNLPQGLIDYATKTLGLTWGGTFSHPDNMHFEWTKPLPQAAAQVKKLGLAPAGAVLSADELAKLNERYNVATPTTPKTAAAGSSGGLSKNQQAFVDKYRPQIEESAAKYGIPVNFMIAQAGLETGWGTNKSFRNQNNPAGIGHKKDGSYNSYSSTSAGFDAMGDWLSKKWGITKDMTDQQAAVKVSTGPTPWADARYRLGSTGNEKDTVPETATRDKYKGLKGTEGQALFPWIDKIKGLTGSATPAGAGGLAGTTAGTGLAGGLTPTTGQLPTLFGNNVGGLPFQDPGPAPYAVVKGSPVVGYQPELAPAYTPSDMSPVADMTAKFANMLNPAYVAPIKRTQFGPEKPVV